MAEVFDIAFTARDYSAGLGYLRKAIVLDRSETVSTVRVSDGRNAGIRLFIRHGDIYLTGIDFGKGPFHFEDPGFTPPAGSRPLGFAGDYVSLGLHGGQLRLDAQTLRHAVTRLARHQPKGAGADFFAEEKQCLIRLIFGISEAIRFWTIQRDVDGLLQSEANSLCINDYAGHDKPLNSWDRWSRTSDWPMRGVFVPTRGSG